MHNDILIKMNKELLELYSLKWNNLTKAISLIYQNESLLSKPTNPLLIKIENEEDYSSADIRLMIFGQETNGWYEMDDSIEGILKGYDDFFNIDYCYSYGGQFWNGISRFITMISKKYPDKKIRYVWNDIVKIGKSEGKGLPPDYIYNVERELFSVIKDEIKIIKPNFLIFFTGPYYDNKIVDNFGKVDFEAIQPFNVRQVAKTKIGNVPAIRTYHPNYLWRNDINSYFDSIIDEIKI